MISPLLSVLMQYGGAVLTGTVFGLLCKAFFASRMRAKIKGYQRDIIQSHTNILELEAKNDQLEKRIKDAEGMFSKDRLFMN